MSLKDLSKRTSLRKASGERQLYPEHIKSDRVTSSVSSSPQTSLPVIPCKYESTLTGSEREALQLSHLKTWKRCSNPTLPLGKDVVCPCQGCGRGCKGYEADSDEEEPSPTQVKVESSNVPCGVAIGSYRWPELVDLQIRLIRSTCGPVPILVSNDHPESRLALSNICAFHPDVTLFSNPERIGHTGGDLAVYYRAVTWGADRGLSVVAKLSQRLFFTSKNWLQGGVKDLLASGLAVSTRVSENPPGTREYPIRTEFALLDVAQWNRPEILSQIKPSRYWDKRVGGWPAEVLLDELIQREFGVYWPTSLLPTKRTDRCNGNFVWHFSHDRKDYDQLASQFGVRLPADFHVGGWEREYAEGKYQYG